MVGTPHGGGDSNTPPSLLAIELLELLQAILAHGRSGHSGTDGVLAQLLGGASYPVTPGLKAATAASPAEDRK